MLQPCWEEAKRRLGPEHAETLADQDNVAASLIGLNRLAEAEKVLAESFRIRSAQLRGATTWSRESMQMLVAALHRLGMLSRAQGRFPEAEKQFRQAWELSRDVFGAKDPDTLAELHSLATAILNQRRGEEALALFTECLALKRETQGPDHLGTLTTQNNLGGALFMLGRSKEAEPVFQAALDGRLKRLPADHSDVIESRTNVVLCLLDLKRFAAAELLLDENLSAVSRRYPGDSVLFLQQVALKARLLERQNRLAEAEPLRRQAAAGYAKVHGADHNLALPHLHELATNLYRQGKAGPAAELYGDAYRKQLKRYGPEHSETLVTAMSYCGVLVELGQFEQVEPLARQVWERHQKRADLNPRHRVEPQLYLGALFVHQGKLAEAEKELNAGLKALTEEPPNLMTCIGHLWLGRCFEKQRRPAEAEKALRGAWEELAHLEFPPPSVRAQVAETLADFCGKHGKPEEAERWRKSASAPSP